jgi:hypothetical protein
MARLRFLKPVLLVVLGGPVLLILHRIGLFLLNPIGGGEFHLIFAHSNGGRIGTAAWVLGESIIVALILGVVALKFGAPGPWWLLATLISVVVVLHWWDVASFPSAAPRFRVFARAIAPIIPLIVFGVLWRLERRTQLRRAKIAGLAA